MSTSSKLGERFSRWRGQVFVIEDGADKLLLSKVQLRVFTNEDSAKKILALEDLMENVLAMVVSAKNCHNSARKNLQVEDSTENHH